MIRQITDTFSSIFCLKWCTLFLATIYYLRRSKRRRALRRRSAFARLLRFWVLLPPGAWMSVCCECCVLSGRGLCDKLITHPEEPYRLWCVVVCDLEASWMRRPWPNGGCRTKKKKITIFTALFFRLSPSFISCKETFSPTSVRLNFSLASLRHSNPYMSKNIKLTRIIGFTVPRLPW